MSEARKFEISNPSGQKIIGEFCSADFSKRLPVIIICSGWGGRMNESHIEYSARNLPNAEYVTVSFDWTNGLGKSDGNTMNMTVGHSLGDLRTIIKHVLNQLFVDTNRLAIFGTSLGGMEAELVSNEFSEIKTLVLHEPVYDFKNIGHLVDKVVWKKQGWIERVSKTLKRSYRVAYEFYQEGLSYNMSETVSTITIPTLVIEGTESKPNIRNAELTFDQLTCKKKKVVIEGAPHNRIQQPQLGQITKAMIAWLDENL